MAVALTRIMSVLKMVARNAALLAAFTAALFSVACAGEPEHQTYTGTDVELDVAETGQPLRCETGSVQPCTIWLGRHGDLSNCIHGLDVCSDGAWTGCIDEVTLSENPALYSELTAAE